MIGDTNRAAGEIGLQQIGKMHRPRFRSARRQAEHLVEIAVEDGALPTYRNQAATHHAIEIFGAVRPLEQRDVRVKLVARDELTAEALDGHVGQREQVVEDDAVARRQLFLVSLFQPHLVGRQGRPERVVDQIESTRPLSGSP